MANWGDLARNAADTGMEFLEQAWKFIQPIAKPVVDFIGKQAGNLWNMVTGTASKAGDAAISALPDPVEKVGRSAINTVGNAAETTVAVVQDLPAQISEVTKGRG
jgi:hypothetical protein